MSTVRTRITVAKNAEQHQNSQGYAKAGSKALKEHHRQAGKIKQEIKQSQKELDELNAEQERIKNTDLVKELKALYENSKKQFDEREKKLGKKVAWQAHPGPQTEFLESGEYEVACFGGRGSGKSSCLMVSPLRYVGHEAFKGLLIRRTMPALREIIGNAKRLYKQIYPGVIWKEQDKMFVFPSGATLEFGYFDHMDDYDRYHGREFCWIGIDEASQYESSEYYERLKSVARKTDAALPVQIRLTSNPSGPGRLWLKEYFVDQAESNVPFKITYNTPIGPIVLTRKYVSSTIFDNPTIVNTNPEYVAYLQSLPEIRKRQWLYGDFEAAEGLAFEEFDTKVHVVKPFDIPDGWVKFRAIDWGFKSKAVCLWFTIDQDKNIYIYREYVTTGVTADMFARNVLTLDDSDYISYGIVDNNVGDERGISGPTIDEQFRNEGLVCRYADKKKGTRIHGKMLIHKYLFHDKEKKVEPKLKVFNTCKQVIKELSSLVLDPHNSEDVDTKMEDHGYDCYSEDTEVLTDAGWKYFKDLDRTEKVATLTPEYKVLYQKPVDYLEEEYRGDMINYNNSGMNFSVTPNHKMVVVNQYNHKILKNDIWSHKVITDVDSCMWIPRTAKWSGIKQDTIYIAGKTWNTNSFFWFIGFWLAEGCSHKSAKNRMFIHADQKKFVEEVTTQYNKFPYHTVKYTNGNGVTRFTIENKELYGWFFDQGLASTLCDTKFIPRWMFEFDSEHLEYLYDGMMLGDGCVTTHSWHYDTTSKQLADDFQEVLFKTNRLGNIFNYFHAQKVNPKHKPTYRINIRNISNVSEIHKKNLYTTKYEGKVYCVTVQEHNTLFVRRNGKAMWCGNCIRYGLLSRPEHGSNQRHYSELGFYDKPQVVDSVYGY